MQAVEQIPLVSIVIPTYNRKELLAYALRSCFRQTWGNLEVLIVDDGSTDGTPECVSSMLQGEWYEDRVTYIRQANRGASAARNHGLGLVRGDYIQFLDSDDLLDSTKIDKQMDVFSRPENREVACCVCYGKLATLSGADVTESGRRIGLCTTNVETLVKELCSRQVHVLQTSAPLWRREYLSGRAGWREDIGLGDDLEYHVRLLAEADKLCCVEEELFIVREHQGSRLSADRLTESALTSQIRTRCAVFEAVKSAGLWDAETQSTFLSAMRTIYANALDLGKGGTIRELEDWLWVLALDPKVRLKTLFMIVFRRLFGQQVLLKVHSYVRQTRGG